MLERDEVPICEPGFEAILSRNVAAERSQAFLRVGRQSGEPTYDADDPVALYRDAFMSDKGQQANGTRCLERSLRS